MAKNNAPAKTRFIMIRSSLAIEVDVPVMPVEASGLLSLMCCSSQPLSPSAGAYCQGSSYTSDGVSGHQLTSDGCAVQWYSGKCQPGSRASDEIGRAHV